MAASVPPGTATPSWHTCIRWTLASRANWRQRCFAVSLLQVSPTAIGRYSPGLPSFSMAVRFAPAMRGAIVLGARPFARSFTTFVNEASRPGTSPLSTASLSCCGVRPEGPPLEPLWKDRRHDSTVSSSIVDSGPEPSWYSPDLGGCSVLSFSSTSSECSAGGGALNADIACDMRPSLTSSVALRFLDFWDGAIFV